MDLIYIPYRLFAEVVATLEKASNQLTGCCRTPEWSDTALDCRLLFEELLDETADQIQYIALDME